MYDYAAGKLDWLAAGLKVEGSKARVPRAGDVARSDVPTCELDEDAGRVAERVRSNGWNTCIVTGKHRVVFGIMRAEELPAGSGRRVEEVMRPGPSTFRPHVGIAEMAGYMTEHDLESAPITTSDGRLVGLLTRDDAVQAAHRTHMDDR